MKSTENKLGTLSKVLLIIAAALLVTSIFTPIWRIELDAPQYPEGLALLIYANKLAGDVDIINGLNHYIGMKTLHAEEFIEFTVLPYIIGFYALFSFLVVFINKKNALYTLFAAFILFGIIAMVDFWRWEYNYGHNLDPNAAIIVPGMAYQPPLIGFKQLLNFGAYSIPDLGGWLFIASGLLMGISFTIESKILKRFKKLKGITPILVVSFLALSSCIDPKSEPIKLNKDKCDNCGMTITDLKFAAELVTKKGRVYKYDDLKCMLNYRKDNLAKLEAAQYYVSNFLADNGLLSIETVFLIKGEELNSPMGGNMAAFNNKTTAYEYATKYKATLVNWTTLTN
jgi:copper chaperone NosL